MRKKKIKRSRNSVNKNRLSNPRNFKLSNTFIIVAVLIIFAGYIWWSYTSQPRSIYPVPITSVTSRPSSSPQPIITNKQKAMETYFYYLQVNQKPNSTVPENLVSLNIARVLKLSKIYQTGLNIGNGQLMYDTRNTDPSKDMYNANYYLLIYADKNDTDYNVNLDTNTTYEDQSLTIHVSIPDAKLLPYLKDVRYCQTDTDCTIKQSWCKNGVEPANYYQWLYSQGGCANSTLIKYSGVKCISNQCTGF